jgi:puromycin-sensitive aminopeptidase
MQQAVRAPACRPLLLNSAARGYYVSMYPPEWLDALTGTAAGWTPSERLQLMADEWWMVRSGRHGVAGFMSLAGHMADDESGAIVEGLQQRLAFADASFVGEAARPVYQQWIRATFSPVLRELGLPGSNGDSDEVKQRRASLLQIVGAIGNDAGVQRQARTLVEQYFAAPESIPPTLVQAALRVAACGGDVALYDLYVSQLKRLQSKPEEYYRVLNALPWFRDPALTYRTLELALSSAVRSQDTGTVIAQAMRRPDSREAAWAFTKAHWSALVGKLDTFQGIPAIVSGIGSFCSAAGAADIRRFFDEHPTPSSTRAIRRSLERVEACSAVADRQAGPMHAFLTSQGSAGVR